MITKENVWDQAISGNLDVLYSCFVDSSRDSEGNTPLHYFFIYLRRISNLPTHQIKIDVVRIWMKIRYPWNNIDNDLTNHQFVFSMSNKDIDFIINPPKAFKFILEENN